MAHESLISLFHTLKIPFTLHEHEPVFTVEQGLHLTESIVGAHSKNLFLRNKKKSYYALVSVLEHKRVDLKKLSEHLSEGRLSFGSEKDMLAKLKLTPGSVTPYGLIHDSEHTIHFNLDKDFLHYDEVNFHPLRNDMTISLTTNDFLRFFDKMNIKVNIINVPEAA